MYHFELKPFKTGWTPGTEWEKEVEKIFDGFNKTHTFAPVCEITDEEKHYSISLDIPGVSRDDVSIEVKDNILSVTGERKSKAGTEKSGTLRRERRYGKFSRAFTLPQNVNAETIEARFENGVLEIVLPKEEKAQPRKIKISDWKNEEVLPEMKS